VKVFVRLLIAFCLAVVADGLTKWWIIQTLTPYRPLLIIGNFLRLTLGFNTGIAFSLFAGGGSGIITAIIGVIIVVLGFWLVNNLRQGNLPVLAAWPVGFIIGGAIANFSNRLLVGGVIDFIDVGLGGWRWPAFNLADSFIVVSIIWLAWIKMSADLSQSENEMSLEESAEP